MRRVNTSKLHQLIISLKKEEKRYFKIFTKKHNQNNDVVYLKVFDYLDKVDEVDRDKFKKKFRAVKGLSGIQTYLYKLILKSLRNQPAYTNIDSLLREGLADLEILFKKELLSAAQEKLKELLDTAELHDKVFFLPMLYDWWFMLENARFRYHNVEESLLDEYINRSAKTIDNLKHYHFYRTQLGRSLFLIKDKNTRQAFDAVMAVNQALPNYDSKEKEYGISTIAQELQLRRILATILLNPSASYYYSKELYSILIQQPAEVFEACKLYYYSSLSSMLLYAPTLETLREIIKEIETTLIENPKLSTENIQMHVIMHKIDIYLLSGSFETFEEFIKEEEQSIEFIKNYVHSHYPSLLHYKMALYHYATKNYTEALTIIDQFLIGKDINGLVKNPSLFLKMIIYYEEEEYILLASFLKNLRRLLRKKESLLDSEKELITLLNGLIKLPESQHKEKLIEARENMVYSLANLDDYKKEFLTFFNYIGWIDSQITRQPFQQLFFRHTGVIKIE